jgi:putative Mg2+ transporter-C (MgtC) family protein
MVTKDQPGQVGIIGSVLGDLGVLIKNINLNRLESENLLEIELLLDLPLEMSIEHVVEELAGIKGLQNIDRLN